MTRIVIIGASFAGLRAYARLKKSGPDDLEVTLIDSEAYATYIPSLHIALGYPRTLRRMQLPLKKYYPEFIQDTITKVEGRTVHGKHGSYEFDYLILATGAPTNFFGNETIKEHTHPAKTAEHIHLLHRKLEPRQHIVIVGGGLSGVEYAAVLAQQRRYSITILNAGEQLLPALPKTASRTAYRYLKRRGVEILLDAKVTEATEKSLQLTDGRFIEQDVTIWCAGIKQGSDLVSGDVDRVYLAGDARKGDQIPTAHNALICGNEIAKQIIGRITEKPYTPQLHNWETLAVALGRWYGVLILYNRVCIPMPFIGMMKWFIERRMLHEWKTKRLLPI